jgi:hypothetical protein
MEATSNANTGTVRLMLAGMLVKRKKCLETRMDTAYSTDTASASDPLKMRLPAHFLFLAD